MEILVSNDDDVGPVSKNSSRIDVERSPRADIALLPFLAHHLVSPIEGNPAPFSLLRDER